MSSDSIYKAVLMDYYRYPRNYKDVSKFSIVKRGKNPRCGDELKIGVDFDNEISKIISGPTGKRVTGILTP